jgi:hypothetical protein
MICDVVAPAIGNTVTYAKMQIDKMNADIAACRSSIRESKSKLLNASPSDRQDYLDDMNRDFQTMKEASVRIMVYNCAKKSVRAGGCKAKTSTGKNCRNHNLMLIDYCDDHAP